MEFFSYKTAIWYNIFLPTFCLSTARKIWAETGHSVWCGITNDWPSVVLYNFICWTKTCRTNKHLLCSRSIRYWNPRFLLNHRYPIRGQTRRFLCPAATFVNFIYIYIYIKVKFSRYRPGVVQRVGRSIALLFHDRGTRRWWVVSSTPRPHFTPGKDPVLILREAGWAPGPVWTGGKSRPHRYSIPDRPARSQSL